MHCAILCVFVHKPLNFAAASMQKLVGGSEIRSSTMHGQYCLLLTVIRSSCVCVPQLDRNGRRVLSVVTGKVTKQTCVTNVAAATAS